MIGSAERVVSPSVAGSIQHVPDSPRSVHDGASGRPRAAQRNGVFGAERAAGLRGERLSSGYGASKRAFDVVVSLILLLPLLLVAATLLVLNPWLNRGPLFFVQDRMGQDCRRFRAWKFRTMTEVGRIERGAFDALDIHRITPLGAVLRKSRIDELPQVFNVLRGEMSLIGPRPDYWDHAVVYLETLPGYRERHSAKPGISGYAQTEVGYVDGIEGMHKKIAADLFYVRHASLRLDSWIAMRTIAVVFGRHGA